MEIRAARPADGPALADLVAAAYAPYRARMDRPPAPVTADYGEMATRGIAYAAREGEELIGALVAHRDGDDLCVDNVAVRPDRQGRGVGRALLAFAEHLAPGCREIRLDTNEAMTENLAFCRRLGYEETGRREDEGHRRVFFRKRLPPPVALVTGGTRGIGLAIARKLAAEHARVFVTARQPPAEPLGEGIAFVQADAGDEAAMRGAVAALPEPPNWLVCNAGTGLVQPLADTPLPELDRLWAINVRGCLLAVQAARDGGRLRSAVLIGSDAGVLGEPATGAYSVTKAALIMMGRMLACDLGPAGIRVNVVCPGDTVPGMREMLAPGQAERPTGEWRAWPLPPLGRYGQPRDTAEAVAFLLSERAGFCNGSVLLVDGGSRAGRR